VTRHSIVRPPDLRVGSGSGTKGATGMTTTTGVEDRRGEESGTTSVEEVVLGVDTHLDAHVAVALDGLGRRLGELSY
jgi:hypothetical protein